MIRRRIFFSSITAEPRFQDARPASSPRWRATREPLGKALLLAHKCHAEANANPPALRACRLVTLPCLGGRVTRWLFHCASNCVHSAASTHFRRSLKRSVPALHVVPGGCVQSLGVFPPCHVWKSCRRHHKSKMGGREDKVGLHAIARRCCFMCPRPRDRGRPWNYVCGRERPRAESGRNARNNGALTLHYTTSDSLWLWPGA